MNKITLKIGGLKCSSCAQRLQEILNNTGNFSANVNFDTGTAIIEFSNEIDTEEIKNIIEFAGYTVSC